jgi:predicted phage terminase large subunit-like protein
MNELERRLQAAQRLLAIREAHDDLLKFARLMMPDPQDLDNVELSRYQITPLARLLTQIFEKIEKRELKRVAISVGPQFGKSQITSRYAPAWMIGRNPRLNMMLGTYNQTFAEEFGDAVREITQTDAFAQIFPRFQLRKGGAAKELLVTTDDGRSAFVGREGSGSGKPADVFIVDDPIKDDVEAQSTATREQTWKWFNKVAMTRCHGDSAIVIVHTRWHQDDLIGRLCDPDHPERHKKYAGLADRWTYINLPAVVDDPKLAAALGLKLEVSTDPRVLAQFGRKPISSLWPSRKPLDFLAEAKQSDRLGFSALYMGQPTPEEGDFFKAADILEYGPGELPSNLRLYGASDHATSIKKSADPTVIGCFGVDEHNNIWVLPDLFWDRCETDETVNELLKRFKKHRPLLWFMENENISKSFGPFLRQRMKEDRIYSSILPMTPAADKKTRARSIQGRFQQKTVYLPRFTSWYADARNQMLRFPNGTNDDFVDFLALAGLGLDSELPAAKARREEDNVVRIDTMRDLLNKSDLKLRSEQRKTNTAGW